MLTVVPCKNLIPQDGKGILVCQHELLIAVWHSKQHEIYNSDKNDLSINKYYNKNFYSSKIFPSLKQAYLPGSFRDFYILDIIHMVFLNYREVFCIYLSSTAWLSFRIRMSARNLPLPLNCKKTVQPPPCIFAWLLCVPSV